MKITGNTVGTTSPRPNYNQTDPSKANYIIGRENILDKDELASATEEALRQAKESGEFDGADGNDGSNGISCTHRWSGTTLYVTSASGTSSANLKGDKGDAGGNGKDGYTPVKGKDYFDGTNGKDGANGISCTHSWNGTPLTITSASRTSSADLKGDPGDAGSSALIVTGTFPTSWISQPQGATSDLTTSNLSHSVDEMCSAFQSGREVIIRLTAPTNVMNYEFGGWNLKFAELGVTSAKVETAGYYSFYAYGMGYAQGSQSKAEATPMQITCSLSPRPILSTHMKDAQKNELVQAVISALPVYDGEVSTV